MPRWCGLSYTLHVRHCRSVWNVTAFSQFPLLRLLAYCTNLFVNKRPGAAASWYISAIELVTMVLEWFLYPAERRVIGFSFMTPRWVKVAARYLSRFGLAIAVASIIKASCNSSLAGFWLPCAYLAYYCSAEVNWSSIDGVHRWFPHGSADVQVHDLIGATLSLRKRDASGTLEANRWYAAQAVVWGVPTAEQGSLTNAVAYMRPYSQGGPEAVDPSPVSPNVHNVSDLDLDVGANGICRIHRLLMESMIALAYGRTSQWIAMNGSRIPSKRPRLFLVCSNWRYTAWIPLVNQGNYWLGCTRCSVPSSRQKHIQSLQRQVLSDPAELQMVWSEAVRLGASSEEVNCQPSVSQAAFFSVKSECEDIWPKLTLKHKSVKIWRRYWQSLGVILTIIRLFSVQLKQCFAMTSIGLCQTSWGLFLTPYANVLWPSALHPQAL